MAVNKRKVKQFSAEWRERLRSCKELDIDISVPMTNFAIQNLLWNANKPNYFDTNEWRGAVAVFEETGLSEQFFAVREQLIQKIKSSSLPLNLAVYRICGLTDDEIRRWRK